MDGFWKTSIEYAKQPRYLGTSKWPLGKKLKRLVLGILGEYVWRAFDESRARPPYIIEEHSAAVPQPKANGGRAPTAGWSPPVPDTMGCAWSEYILNRWADAHRSPKCVQNAQALILCSI